MTEFDQPDCAFSAPRRSNTTTPLQALSMLNHSFTFDMAAALADRLKTHSANRDHQIAYGYRLCFGRSPDTDEITICREYLSREGNDLASLCRVLLNTSEFIYVR